MKTMFRQGDVLFLKLARHPKGKATIRKNGHILEGEGTGHVHRVETLTDAEVYEIESCLFISVGENGVSIVHPDHNPISLPPGDYEVIRQREYAPDEIRNVQD